MLYSLAVLLVALAALVIGNPGGYLVVSALFAPPFLGVPALAPLWGGLLGRSRACRGAVDGAGSCHRPGGLRLGMVRRPELDGVLATGSDRAAERPSGGLEVRVIGGALLIDTVWGLRVRRPAGLLTREWSAGFLNGDDPDNGFVSVRWNGPQTLVVTAQDGRVVRVDLDPATGRTLRLVVTGTGC